MSCSYKTWIEYKINIPDVHFILIWTFPETLKEKLKLHLSADNDF